jgi:hypothetical protein
MGIMFIWLRIQSNGWEVCLAGSGYRKMGSFDGQK